SASGSIIEYAFEIEDFSRIEYNTTNLTFTLKLKNGTIIEYGCAGNSKLIPENSTTPFAYYINKITDRNGNYIEYIYDNTEAECVIKEIKYTGNTNASVQPYNSIKFYYSIRADKNKFYIADKKINFTKILRKIKVYSYEQLVRTYNLNYHRDNYQKDLYSQLIEIEEIGLNSEKVNSTIIQYGNDGILHVVPPTYFNQNSQFTFIKGDFNGDGRSDIVAASTNYFYGMKQLSNYTIQDVVGELNNSGNFSNFCYISNSENTYLDNAAGSYIADFNGDNIEDILLLDIISSFELNKIKIYKGGDVFSIQDIAVDNTFKYLVPYANNIYTGDFNGDGLTDYITVLCEPYTLWNLSEEQCRVTFGIPQNNFSAIISNIGPFTLLMAHEKYIIDFNGDGKQDIMVVFPDKIEIYELNLSGTTYTLDLLYETNTLNSGYEFVFGDFNGDGKTDFYTYGESIASTNWKYKYSTGTDMIDKWFQPSTGLSGNYKFVVGDFNGDGKSDLLHAYTITGPPDYFCIDIYYSYGNDFVLKYYGFLGSMGEELIVGDFDADGSHDILNLTTDENNRKVLYFNKITDNIDPENARPLLVTKIKDGFNNWVEFEYWPITHASVYSDDASWFPYAPDYYTSTFKAPLMVVSKLKEYNGTINILGDGYNFTDYMYYAAIYNKEGKGFLGFMRTESYPNSTVTTTKLTRIVYVYNQEYEILLPWQSLFCNVLNPNNDIVNTNYYDYTDLGNNRFMIKLDQTEQENKLNYTHIIEDNTIDNNGNITDKEIQYKKLNDIQDKKETYTYTYDNAGLDYPYLVKTIQKVSFDNNSTGPPFTEDIVYSYNAQNGNPESKMKFGITIHYENYDNFGNPRTIRQSAQNMTDRTQLFTFDNTGRFITNATNYLGHTTYSEYNNPYGRPSRIVDINQKATNYSYDKWGRLKKVVYPTGIIAENFIDWQTIQDPEMETAIYYTQTTATDMPYKKTYYDSFGRKLRSESESYGKKIFTDSRYDRIGRVTETSDIYFEGDYVSANRIENEFDDFSRISKTTYQGIETDYYYNIVADKYEEKVRVPSLDRNYTSVFNAFGNVVESKHPVSTKVLTTFNGNGQPENINSVGATSSMTYYLNGLQKTLTDPNSGTSMYEYNNFGELIKQTDAKNNIQEIEIDEHGRIGYSTNTDGQTNITEQTDFTYIESGNGLEQVKSVESPNGKMDYTYDGFGRVTQTKETIDGHYYTTIYKYDQYGKLVKETYPGTGDFALEYSYNNNGELLSVKRADNNQTIWYCNDYNENGQPGTIFLGDNGSSLTTEYEYDDFGRISYISTANNFEMSYLWNDITGNLDSRTDMLSGLTESFTYDDLDRLKTWQVSSGSLPGIAYETYYYDNGNILSKTDAGDYEYDAAKVHAVKKINSATAYISTEQQALTYTSFNKASTITEGEYELQLQYGVNDFRNKTVLKQKPLGQVTQPKHFGI
ncbi:MAG: VCBS repeat-containing protein, partial [Bacteroidia bacterium]|nr:VCBS repeat-containing protein [Bacteroidia bacterium]